MDRKAFDVGPGQRGWGSVGPYLEEIDGRELTVLKPDDLPGVWLLQSLIPVVWPAVVFFGLPIPMPYKFVLTLPVVVWLIWFLREATVPAVRIPVSSTDLSESTERLRRLAFQLDKVEAGPHRSILRRWWLQRRLYRLVRACERRMPERQFLQKAALHATDYELARARRTL